MTTPRTVVALYLCALAALYWAGVSPWLLGAFALAAAAAGAVRGKVHGEAGSWLLRFACYLTALFGVLLAPSNLTGLIDPRWMNLFAMLCAAECLVQCWRAAPTMGALLALPCLMMLAAGNTFESGRLLWIMPVFALLLALSLPRYRRHPSVPAPATLAVTGALIAATLGLGAVSNALLDRYKHEIYQWGEQLMNRQPRHTAGLALNPRLGRTFNLRGSPKRVMRLSGYRGDGYLRGLAFDSYVHGRWLPSAEVRLMTAYRPDTSVPTQAMPARVTKYDRLDNLLFAPLQSAAFLAGGAQLEWSPQHGGPVRGRDETVMAYDLMPARNADATLWPAPDWGQHQQLLELPDDLDPRVRQLAREIGAGTATAEQRIAAVARHLTTHHHYSLTTDPGAGDPVTNFLLQRKDAHCEYFAAAATLLLRCQGVPTRYVIGFLAHETDREGVTIVRMRDAHAWAESWVEGRGWVTVETTPPDGRPDQLPDRQPSRLRRAWEGMQDALMRLQGAIASLSMPQLAALIALVIVPYFLYHMLRGRRAHRATADGAAMADDPAVLALGERFTAWLARTGRPCPATSTWADHLMTWERGDDARLFVQLYYQTRFGAQRDAATLARLDEMLRRLESETPRSDRK